MLSKPTPNLPINFSLENSDKISLLSFVLFLIIIPSVSFENFNIGFLLIFFKVETHNFAPKKKSLIIVYIIIVIK